MPDPDPDDINRSTYSIKECDNDIINNITKCNGSYKTCCIEYGYPLKSTNKLNEGHKDMEDCMRQWCYYEGMCSLYNGKDNINKIQEEINNCKKEVDVYSTVTTQENIKKMNQITKDKTPVSSDTTKKQCKTINFDGDTSLCDSCKKQIVMDNNNNNNNKNSGDLHTCPKDIKEGQDYIVYCKLGENTLDGDSPGSYHYNKRCKIKENGHTGSGCKGYTIKEIKEGTDNGSSSGFEIKANTKYENLAADTPEVSWIDEKGSIAARGITDFGAYEKHIGCYQKLNNHDGMNGEIIGEGLAKEDQETLKNLCGERCYASKNCNYFQTKRFSGNNPQEGQLNTCCLFNLTDEKVIIRDYIDEEINNSDGKNNRSLINKISDKYLLNDIRKSEMIKKYNDNDNLKIKKKNFIDDIIKYRKINKRYHLYKQLKDEKTGNIWIGTSESPGKMWKLKNRYKGVFPIIGTYNGDNFFKNIYKLTRIDTDDKGDKLKYDNTSDKTNCPASASTDPELFVNYTNTNKYRKRLIIFLLLCLLYILYLF